MTFANGGDNISVYVPVFVSVSWSAVLAYCIVFLVLVAVLVFLAKWISSRKPIAEALERWEHILFPAVHGLGIVILSAVSDFRQCGGLKTKEMSASFESLVSVRPNK